MRVDVAIVGGGPAGMAALELLTGAGLTVALIDEQQALGGQILRQPPAQFSVTDWLTGASYRRVKAQLRRVEQVPGVAFHRGTSVVGLFRTESGDFTLWLAGGDGVRRLQARHVVLAPGCYDLPVPLPGWTLPGVMTAGGLQSLLKSQQLVAGDQILLAGTHPLLLILAQQIVTAGGQVAAVLLARPASHVLRLVRYPGLMLTAAGPLGDVARALLSLRRARVPVQFGRTVVAVEGRDRVEAARVAAVDPGGRLGATAPQSIPCDTVALGFGFLPQSELARFAGADAHWAEPCGGWAIRHDAWMESSVPGLWVAGEIAGVAGAEVALLEGGLAAYGVLIDCGRLSRSQAEHRAGPLRRRLVRLRRFAALLADLSSPADLLPQLPTEDTILCRCEQVRFNDLDQVATGSPPVTDANAAKLMIRAGMGLCQGRMCETATLRRLAGHRPGAPAKLSGFTPRFPLKPIPISDLLDMEEGPGLEYDD